MGSERCCENCAYALRFRTRWLRVILARWPGLLFCFQHPDAPGAISEVVPSGTCPNFQVRSGRGKEVASVHSPDAAVRYIPLTRGRYAIVDAEDYPALAKYKWHAQLSKNGTVCYAVRNVGRKTIMMHREIMKPPAGFVVDHINHNGADNRRCNLRVCTQAENVRNCRGRGTGSRYKGVRPRREQNKWQARIAINGRGESIGCFDSEIEAALAYDLRAIVLFGQFAYLNFPDITNATRQAQRLKSPAHPGA